MPIDNRSMPAAPIIPVLSYPDVRKAVVWLCRTFGFSERLRVADHRSQVWAGNGCVVIALGRPEAKPCGVSIMVRVFDIDAHHRRVIENGATVFQKPKKLPFGERQYTVKDPGGHEWIFTETVEDTDPRLWGAMPVEEPFWK